MGDGFLHKYFLNNGGKQPHKWVYYFDNYERYFERFRGKSPTIIEIGVFGGGSLAMWKNYFGAGSEVIGADINPACKQHQSDDIEIFIGSQDDPNISNAILGKYPSIDIVLDDGSHVMQHMIAIFNLLYQKVNSSGIYMVEDTPTCYWPKIGGGVKVEGSFMEFVKDKLDEINAVRSLGKLPFPILPDQQITLVVMTALLFLRRSRRGKDKRPLLLPWSEFGRPPPASRSNQKPRPLLNLIPARATLRGYPERPSNGRIQFAPSAR